MVKVNGRCQRILGSLGECWVKEVPDRQAPLSQYLPLGTHTCVNAYKMCLCVDSCEGVSNFINKLHIKNIRFYGSRLIGFVFLYIELKIVLDGVLRWFKCLHNHDIRT